MTADTWKTISEGTSYKGPMFGKTISWQEKFKIGPILKRCGEDRLCNAYGSNCVGAKKNSRNSEKVFLNMPRAISIFQVSTKAENFALTNICLWLFLLLNIWIYFLWHE